MKSPIFVRFLLRRMEKTKNFSQRRQEPRRRKAHQRNPHTETLSCGRLQSRLSRFSLAALRLCIFATFSETFLLFLFERSSPSFRTQGYNDPGSRSMSD